MIYRDIKAPEFAQQDEEVAALTLTENVLTRIIAETLERQNVNVGDDFLRLGGQSIMALGVVNRVREALGVEIPLQLLLDGETTIRSLSEEIDIAKAETRNTKEP